jgi:hypothetical protein
LILVELVDLLGILEEELDKLVLKVTDVETSLDEMSGRNSNDLSKSNSRSG